MRTQREHLVSKEQKMPINLGNAEQLSLYPCATFMLSVCQLTDEKAIKLQDNHKALEGTTLSGNICIKGFGDQEMAPASLCTPFGWRFEMLMRKQQNNAKAFCKCKGFWHEIA